MMRAILTIGFLIIANVFMTFAWYGHLKFKEINFFQNWGLVAFIFFSWGIALFEYFFQVPANRIGFEANGGPFNLWQLKVLQEIINLVIFSLFTIFIFKNQTMNWNHIVGFVLLVLAVFFYILKKIKKSSF